MSGWIVAVIWLVACGLLLHGCNDSPKAPNKFPKEVDKIFKAKCSIQGCHNAASKDAAAGLNLESWDALFEGSRGGSPVIPYSPDQSFLLYAMNVDSSLGPVLKPTMPVGGEPLDAIDYQLIRHWIMEGAKNRDREEPYPPVADRRKWYIGHFGCDLVAVVDVESKNIMRYISIGSHEDLDDALYDVTVSPKGDFWYASFADFNSTLDKFSTLTDEKVASIPLGHQGWNHFTLAPDGKLGFLVSLYSREVVAIDLEHDILAGTPLHTNLDILSATVHPTRNQIYLPAISNSSIVVIDYASDGTLSNSHELDLVQNIPAANPGELQPIQMAFSPDGSKYFVACYASKEVRIFNAGNDSLLSVIQLQSGPASLAVSNGTGRIFAACPDDQLSFPEPDKYGAIAVIDMSTNQLIGMRYAGYQPYGMAVDDASGYLLVAARNQLLTGPSQHHQSACGGRNGYLTLLDLETLDPVAGFKTELSVDPITLSVKY